MPKWRCSDEPTPVEEKVDNTVYETVADAYYRRVIDAPTTARTNSQSSYTIAAAVAAALVTAGAFADLEGEPLGVRLVGSAALLAWLLTAAAFMYALAAPHLKLTPKAHSELEFVERAIEDSRSERNTVNKRQFFARFGAGLASLLTVSVVALALFLPEPSPAKIVTVSLSPGDRARLSLLCGQQIPTVVKGTADPGSPDDGTIAFDPEKRLCKTPGATTLQEQKTTYILAP